MTFSPRQLPALFQTGLALLALLASSILLASCASVKVNNPRTNLELAPAPYFDETTGIYFPGALGNLFRQPVIELEERSPGLGLAISYRDSETRIDLFVYDLQASVIPTGIDSDVVKKSFQDAVQDLHIASKKKIYFNLEVDDAQPSAVVNTPFLHTQFRYSEALAQKEGQLFVSGVNGQILKIRTTKRLQSDTDLEHLLDYIGYAIDQSHRNGFGGLNNRDYQNIVAKLAKIDLRNGLSPEDATSIAQIEAVKLRLHNRYDLSRPDILPDTTTSTTTISFPPYASIPPRLDEPHLSVQVLRDGSARILTELD